MKQSGANISAKRRRNLAEKERGSGARPMVNLLGEEEVLAKAAIKEMVPLRTSFKSTAAAGE